MITKEICRDYALKIKQETGEFPLKTSWLLKNGFPCGSGKLTNLFGEYNNFRDYCNEPHIQRTADISLEWVKSNCIIDENQCWNWNKALKEDGYGLLTYKRKIHRVHRLTYELVNGDISSGLLVRHKCDNRKCCSPDHLELGTNSDNMLDSSSRSLNKKLYESRDLISLVKKLKSLEERLNFYLTHINIDNKDCWVSYLLKPATQNYYQINFEGKLFRLHRLVLANKLNKKYEEINIARHVCNNKSCINPTHLEEGTVRDNSLDFRQYSKNSKLDSEKVKDIKTALKLETFKEKGSRGKFDKFWAEKFGVSPNTINNVRLGSTWKDIII